MSEWREVLLSEISEDVSYGYTESASEKKIGPKFLRITDIQGGIVNWANVPYCSISEKDLEKYRLKKNDIVVARTGNSTGENYLFESDEVAVYASYLIKFSLAKDVFPKYVWYTMRSKNWWSFIEGNKTGSAQAGANAKTLSNFSLLLPPLPEQKAIAHILGILDEKIELNRQMNQTLGAMSQGLFRSWFVDFDPVIDNALAQGNPIPEELQARAEKRKGLSDSKKLLSTNPSLAAQFPSSFVFNETLGKWIPEGWEVGKLGDRYFVKGGYAFKSKDFVEESGIPVVKIKSIKGDNTVDKSELSMVKSSVAKKRQNFWLNNGDILMAMTGATIGKFGVLVKEDYELIVLNQRVAKFHPVNQDFKTIWFVYCYFNDSKNTDFIVNTAQGSAQPNISANEIMSAPIVKSNISLLIEFEKTVSKNFQKILENQKQIQTLTQLRDSLLPELICGRVRVPIETK